MIFSSLVLFINPVYAADISCESKGLIAYTRAYPPLNIIDSTLKERVDKAFEIDYIPPSLEPKYGEKFRRLHALGHQNSNASDLENIRYKTWAITVFNSVYPTNIPRPLPVHILSKTIWKGDYELDELIDTEHLAYAYIKAIKDHGRKLVNIRQMLKIYLEKMPDPAIDDHQAVDNMLSYVDLHLKWLLMGTQFWVSSLPNADFNNPVALDFAATKIPTTVQQLNNWFGRCYSAYLRRLPGMPAR